jgi:hypothetical protein
MDQVAQLLDEAVGALNLLTNLAVGYRASSSNGGSPR